MCTKSWSVNPEWERPHESPRRKLEISINMDLEECETVDQIHLAQDTVQWL